MGLAWDCGAVTTGPVTVPLLMALGLGVASHSRPRTVQVSDELNGFGIIALASLYPVTTVFLLACFMRISVSPETEATFVAEYLLQAGSNPDLSRLANKPLGEIALSSLLAIVPLAAFVLLVLRALSTPLSHVTLPDVITADGEVKLALAVPAVSSSRAPTAESQSGSLLDRSRGAGGDYAEVRAETSRWVSASVLIPGLFVGLGGMFLLNIGLARGLALLAEQVERGRLMRVIRAEIF